MQAQIWKKKKKKNIEAQRIWYTYVKNVCIHLNEWLSRSVNSQ